MFRKLPEYVPFCLNSKWRLRSHCCEDWCNEESGGDESEKGTQRRSRIRSWLKANAAELYEARRLKRCRVTGNKSPPSLTTSLSSRTTPSKEDGTDKLTGTALKLSGLDTSFAGKNAEKDPDVVQ